ncbi:hypothetical protein [Comamonas sp. NLF-1-9]|uniref:hypothetical protein n=1 Tax=Comamonas sp. NLF-1-9 TaxID=2853163 RepID=UPI001C45EDC6|nr:hypothetical protein [Comamonas sp. NLF-1-9]QXL84639.1 hypothetical protein KUD94_01185 [Comamonas sp. NLF-1-9]
MRFRLFRSKEAPAPAAQPGVDPVGANAKEERIEPLINAHHLSTLALRRELLDWRDEAHMDITHAAVTLHAELIKCVDKRLNEKGLIGRLFMELFADPANKLLLKGTIQRITKPMHACLDRLEASLAMLAQKSAHRLPLQPTFDRKRLETMDFFLSGLKVKSSARDEIAHALKGWLLEPGGLAAELRDQATRMSDQLMQESKK